MVWKTEDEREEVDRGGVMAIFDGRKSLKICFKIIFMKIFQSQRKWFGIFFKTFFRIMVPKARTRKWILK